MAASLPSTPVAEAEMSLLSARNRAHRDQKGQRGSAVGRDQRGQKDHKANAVLRGQMDHRASEDPSDPPDHREPKGYKDQSDRLDPLDPLGQLERPGPRGQWNRELSFAPQSYKTQQTH
jgi:hypothetical protein